MFNDFPKVIQVLKCLLTAKHYYLAICVAFLPETSLLFKEWGKAPVSFNSDIHFFEELILYFHCLEAFRKLLV